LFETKLENTGSTKLTSMQNVKIAHAVIGITKLVTKYFLEKMVSSANQKVNMKVILGTSHQLIQMGQSGFNAEQNQNIQHQESHTFFQPSHFTGYKCCFSVLYPYPIQTLPFTETFQFVTLVT
jgi:hypothetical protein